MNHMIPESLLIGVARTKHRFQRSLTYVSWLQTPLMALTLLNTLVLLGLDLSIRVWGPILLVLMIAGLLVVGYLDEQLGVLQAEGAHSFIHNPEFAKLREDVEEIKRLVK